MSMMWPPHRVKIVSTPSAFSAFATRCPPEIVAEMTATNAKIQSLAGVLQSEIDPPSHGLEVGGPLRRVTPGLVQPLQQRPAPGKHAATSHDG